MSNKTSRTFTLWVDDASHEGGYAYTNSMEKIHRNLESVPEEYRHSLAIGTLANPEGFAQVFHYGLYICVILVWSNDEGRMMCFHRDYTPPERTIANIALESVLPPLVIPEWWGLYEKIKHIPSDRFDHVELIVSP